MIMMSLLRGVILIILVQAALRPPTGAHSSPRAHGSSYKADFHLLCVSRSFKDFTVQIWIQIKDQAESHLSQRRSWLGSHEQRTQGKSNAGCLPRAPQPRDEAKTEPDRID